MSKKYMAAILAFVLTLTLSLPVVVGASGAGGGSDGGTVTLSSGSNGTTLSTTFDSMMKLATLNIEVTNQGALILNPYRLKYESQAETGFTGSADFMFEDITKSSANVLDGDAATYRQIISSPLVIKSETEVPIKVGVTVSCAVTSSNDKNKVTMSATRPISDNSKPDTSKKTVCMWISAGVSEAGSDEGDAVAAARLVDPFASNYAKGGANEKDASKPFLILSETKAGAKGVENNYIMTIPSGYDNGSASPSYGVLLFDGEMIPMPTDNPWTANDLITPTVTINLQAMPFEVPSSEVVGPLPSV